MVGMALSTAEAGLLKWQSIEDRMVRMAQSTSEDRVYSTEHAEDGGDSTYVISGWRGSHSRQQKMVRLAHQTAEAKW